MTKQERKPKKRKWKAGKATHKPIAANKKKVKELWELGYSKTFIAIRLDIAKDTLMKHYGELLIEENKGASAAGLGRTGILRQARLNNVSACRILLEMGGEINGENTLRITTLPTLVRLDAEGNEIE